MGAHSLIRFSSPTSTRPPCSRVSRRRRGPVALAAAALLAATLTPAAVGTATAAPAIPPAPAPAGPGALLGSTEGLGQNVAGMIGGTGAGPGVSSGTGEGPDRYVALGDSYAAVGRIAPGAWAPGPVGCVRTSDAYPTVVARELGVGTFVNAACGGAVTDDFWAPDEGVPPQFDALTEDTDLVTMSIGGNDVGFGAVIMACAVRTNTPEPLRPALAMVGGELSEGFDTSKGCADVIDRQAAAALDELDAHLDEVYAEIARRSPDAKVVTTGYLAAMPETDEAIRTSPACSVLMGATRTERDKMRGFQNDLNDVVRAAARRNGATVVIPDEPGHSMCSPAHTRWVDLLGVETGSAPVHPTTAGHAHVAERVVVALRAGA